MILYSIKSDINSSSVRFPLILFLSTHNDNDNDNDAPKCVCALLSFPKNPECPKTPKNEDFTRIVYLVNSTLLYSTLLYSTIHCTYISTIVLYSTNLSLSALTFGRFL